MVEMRDKRYTLQAIGNMFGVSRERVRQIVNNITLNSPIPPIHHKILTPARQKLLGLPNNPIKTGQRDRVREWVRIRDKRTCQICYRVWKEGERRFDVHHLDEKQEGRSGETGRSKWDFANMHRMVTLCHRCHLRLDSVRSKMATKPYTKTRISNTKPGNPH